MLQGIEAIIFDLDGTLIDSMWVWKQVDDSYMKQYRLVEPENFHETMEGMSYTEVAEYFREVFQLPKSAEEIKQEWLDMTLALYQTEVELKSGVKELLAYCKEHEIRLGIATSNTRTLVESVLEAREIRDYFQGLCTACEVSAGKPAPDVYLKVAKDLEVAPEKCLVFEDVLKGVQAGKNAGMKVCAVEDKGNILQREALRKQADYYIHGYEEILNKTYEVSK